MSLYDAAKDALRVAQKIDNIELIQKIMDLQSGVLELQEKNQLLKTELDAIRDKGNLGFDGEHTWLIDKDSSTGQRFCPVCYDNDNVRSLIGSNDFCMRCNADYV